MMFLLQTLRHHRIPAFFFFIISIYVVFWSVLPIYVDENAYVIFLSRAFLDGWKRIGLYSPCASTDLLPIPFFFYPAAFIFSGYTLIKDTQWYRYIGEAIYFASVILVYITAQKATKNNLADRYSRYIPLLVLTVFVGVLSASSVMVRPEGLLLLCITFACRNIFRTDNTHRYPRAIFMMLIYAMAVYAHPKALFLFPAIFAAIAFVLPNPTMRKTFLAVLVLTIIQGTILQSKQCLQCPEVPTFEAILQKKSINPLQAFLHPVGFLQELADLNTHREWSKFTKSMLYRNGGNDGTYNGNIPASHLNQPIIKITNRLIILCELMAWLLGLALFYKNSCVLVDHLRRKTAPPTTTLVLTLFYASIFCMALLDRDQYFYAIGFWLNALIILNTLSLASLPKSVFCIDSNLKRKCAFTFVTLNIIVFFLSLYISYSDIFSLIKEPPLAVTQQNVEDALKLCHLSATSPRLVYDELTYPYLQRSAQPISLVWSNSAFPTQQETMDWFRAHSSGIVTHYPIPDGLGIRPDQVKSSGNVYCVNFGELQ